MPEVYQNHYYPPVGRCIYCGATEDSTALTDEHIVARALGGKLILQKASCSDCNRIVGAGIEQKCFRHMLEPLRDGLGLAYRRRKKDRPTTVPSHVQIGGEWRLLDTPSDMRMDPTMMYHFPVPGILLRISPEDAGKRPLPGVWVASRVKKSTLRWVEAQAPEASVYRVASADFEPILFQKMLGKKPWHSGYLVGELSAQEPQRNAVYEVGMRYLAAPDGTPLIGVMVRFFGGMRAPAPPPAYLVIVGLPLYANSALVQNL